MTGVKSVTFINLPVADATVPGGAGADSVVVRNNAGAPDKAGAGPWIALPGATKVHTFDGMGGNDTLTVDYSKGFNTTPINFNGGDQTGAPGDKIVVTDGKTILFDKITFNYDGPNATPANGFDGSIVYEEVPSPPPSPTPGWTRSTPRARWVRPWCLTSAVGTAASLA